MSTSRENKIGSDDFGKGEPRHEKTSLLRPSKTQN